MGTKHAGTFVLLYVGDDGDPESFTRVAAQRVGSLTLGNEPIDVTDKDDSRWRKLLAGGVRGLEMTASGWISDSATFNLLCNLASQGLIRNWEIQFASGLSLVAPCMLTSTELTGEYTAAQQYTLSLSSADDVTAYGLDGDTVQFSAGSYAPSGSTALVTVTRTGLGQGAVSVDYTTADGTAVAGTNYTATSGTLNWADGDTASKTFEVQILEGNDLGAIALSVSLADPVGATIGIPNPATITIPQNPFGALVTLAGGAVTSPVPWDTEVYDVGAWHSLVNPERLTVPGATELVRLIHNADTNAATLEAEMRKGGSTFIGAGKGDTASIGTNHINMVGFDVAAAQGNYYDTITSQSTQAGGWFAAERLPPTTKIALFNKSGSQALTGGVETAISFNSEVIDETHSPAVWHSGAASKYIVPAGVDRIQVAGLIETDSVAGQVLAIIKVNGTQQRGCPGKDQDTGGAERLTLASPTLDVAEGDELEIYVTAAANCNVLASSWFAILEPADNVRSMIRKSAAQGFASQVFEILTFDAVVSDPSGMHDGVGFTIGAGVTQARVACGLRVPTSTDQSVFIIEKNGANVPGLPQEHTDTATEDNLCGFGAWFPVSQGDEIRMNVLCENAATIVDHNGLYMAIEVR